MHIGPIASSASTNLLVRAPLHVRPKNGDERRRRRAGRRHAARRDEAQERPVRGAGPRVAHERVERGGAHGPAGGGEQHAVEGLRLRAGGAEEAGGAGCVDQQADLQMLLLLLREVFEGLHQGVNGRRLQRRAGGRQQAQRRRCIGGGRAAAGAEGEDGGAGSCCLRHRGPGDHGGKVGAGGRVLRELRRCQLCRLEQPSKVGLQKLALPAREPGPWRLLLLDPPQHPLQLRGHLTEACSIEDGQLCYCRQLHQSDQLEASRQGCRAARVRRGQRRGD
jgi:hypothetical protein